MTLDGKRRLTVPLALAPTTPGDAFDARFDEEEDAMVFRRIRRGGKSWLDILKTCPLPMDDVPRRSREYPGNQDCELAARCTGNDRDFRRPGVKVFNPLKELP